MKKNKGMKIYKQRKKKRGNNYQILSILGTVSLVFGAGIFGYYVIAVPIRDVIQSLIENQDTVTKILDMVPDVVDKIKSKFGGSDETDEEVNEAIDGVAREYNNQ